MNKESPTFKVGDRVKMLDAAKETSSFENGIVVSYHGKHDPKEPRVRWASGWGMNFKAKELRLMTAEEMAELPIPQLFDMDK